MSNSFSSDGEQGGSTSVAEQVLEIIEDTHDDLAPCGSSTLQLVRQAIAALNSGVTTPSSTGSPSSHIPRAGILATSLLRLADEKLNTFPYTAVPLHWRRLYTDATLLGALASLSAVAADGVATEIGEAKKQLEETVKKLDMALIIAGAPGEGREELVFALMEVSQDRLRAQQPKDGTASPPPSKKRRLCPSPPLPPPYINRPLPVLPSLPSFLRPCPTQSQPFDPSHPHSSPFVVRGACSPSTGWNAVERWRDREYLLQKAGPGRFVPVEVGGDYTKENWGQRIMPFDEFLSTLSPSPSPSSPSDTIDPPPLHYLAQHSLFRQFPSLLSDLTIPDLVYSAPGMDGNGGAYEGVKTEDGFVMNAWFGPGGTKSAAHTDPWWNVYVQVTGSKWVWVAPPSCSSAMAAFGSSSSTPAPSSYTSDASTQAQEYMSNTSSLDVTVPPPLPSSSLSSSSTSTDDDAPTSTYYPPSWLGQVEPFARQVVLEAGDVLVMPPKWWHAMQSLEPSFSVSIWF